MAEMSYEEVTKKKYELWAARPTAIAMETAPTEKRLVAEGDSWFDYPPGLDILDNLKDQFGYTIHKVAESGDTLDNMVYGTEIKGNFQRKLPQIEETLRAIARHKPKAVLFSAGGNDIAGYEMESFLNHVDSGLGPFRLDYARYIFDTVFQKGYEDFFQKVWAVNPEIHVISHGYGRAIPDGRAVRIVGIKFSGPWLRPALAKKGVDDATVARKIIADMMDMFNEMLKRLATKHPRFHFIDLRAAIQETDWVNELHLSNDAYRMVAGRFHDVIKSL